MHGGNRDDGWVLEPCEGLLRRNNASEDRRQQDEHGDGIVPPTAQPKRSKASTGAADLVARLPLETIAREVPLASVLSVTSGAGRPFGRRYRLLDDTRAKLIP